MASPLSSVAGGGELGRNRAALAVHIATLAQEVADRGVAIGRALSFRVYAPQHELRILLRHSVSGHQIGFGGKDRQQHSGLCGRASARDTEVGQRLMEIPGIGPLLASAFVASVADPQVLKTGRDLAAWIGLVPRQNSSGGKERLGGISRAGNQYLRQMLVVGSMAVIRHAERHGTKRPWLIELMKRRAKKVAAVALANKTARMVWALMTSGEHYREPQVAHA